MPLNLCKVKSSTSFSADLGDGYAFPTHVVPTDLRPDLVWWDEETNKLVLVELTIAICCCTRKEMIEVIDGERGMVFVTLITIEMGSRGVPSPPGFKHLQRLLGLSRSESATLLSNCIMTAIAGSFYTWANRNQLKKMFSFICTYRIMN